MGTTNTFDVEAIVRAYAESLLRQAVDVDADGNEILLDEMFTIFDLPPETWDRIRREVREFVQDAADDLQGMSEVEIGHNLVLTRNRHGAGFWDLGLGERGDRLTEKARLLGTHEIYMVNGELVDY